MDCNSLPLDSIICGDNCQVLCDFEPESIDLVVTSPPYDDLRTYGGHDWDFYGIAWQLSRVIKKGGVIVWVVADQTKDGTETGTSFRQALHFQSLGLNIHDTMIYKTNKPPKSSKRYTDCIEFMFVFSKGQPATWNPIEVPCIWAGVGCSPSQRTKDGTLIGNGRRMIKDTKPRENIWHYETGSGKTESMGHPATFPLQLATDHVMTWTNEGDVVLDPFCGSGTSCEAAKRNARRFIGVDVNESYCHLSIARTAQQELFS